MFFAVTGSLQAQSKLDIYLLQAQRRHVAQARKCASREALADESISVMAILRPGQTLPEAALHELGVSVGRQVGRVVSLQVPMASLDGVSALGAIESLSANRQHSVTCFNTRQETGVAELHGFSTEIPEVHGYTGQGVLIGMIDTGIEYNHLNFLSPATGQTRLKGAVLYRSEEGDAADIREYYTQPAQIDTLTTDNSDKAHGTHTTGVAAGSYPGLGLQGMAPEADLMLCGTKVLKDDRLIDALYQTFALADELDEPCVVNLSIGNPIGWKDGLSPLNLACEALTDGGKAPGRVIVFSAGNDGAKPYVAHHEFQDSLPVYALLQPYRQQGEDVYINPNLDVYCSDSLPLRLDYHLYDTLRHEFLPLPFEQHLLDTIEAGHSNRRHLLLDADTCHMSPYPNCRLAAQLQGTPGSSFTLYYINRESVSYAILPGGTGSQWLCGSPEGSISDLCTTQSVLSAGAYCAVDSLVNIFGRVHHPDAPRHHVCGFSSYGHSWQGDAYPDVLCPGAAIISGYSRFWADMVTYYYTSGRYLDSPMMYVITPEAGGPTYYWVHAVGTSLSAPVLAGIIALWMQACPTLSVQVIRQILRQSSRFDDYCMQAPGGLLQAGCGKVDAVAGLQAVLALAGQTITTLPEPTTGVCFDLMGRPLRSANSGLFLRNGVKVFKTL